MASSSLTVRVAMLCVAIAASASSGDCQRREDIIMAKGKFILRGDRGQGNVILDTSQPKHHSDKKLMAMMSMMGHHFNPYLFYPMQHHHQQYQHMHHEPHMMMHMQPIIIEDHSAMHQMHHEMPKMPIHHQYHHEPIHAPMHHEDMSHHGYHNEHYHQPEHHEYEHHEHQEHHEPEHQHQESYEHHEQPEHHHEHQQHHMQMPLHQHHGGYDATNQMVSMVMNQGNQMVSQLGQEALAGYNGGLQQAANMDLDQKSATTSIKASPLSVESGDSTSNKTRQQLLTTSGSKQVSSGHSKRLNPFAAIIKPLFNRNNKNKPITSQVKAAQSS